MSEPLNSNPPPSFDDSLNAILEHFNQLMTTNPTRETVSRRPSGAATLLNLISKELQTTEIKKPSPTPQDFTPKPCSFPKLPAEPSYPAPINPNLNLIRHRSHGSFRPPPQIPPRRQRARSIAPPTKSLLKTVSRTQACGELLEPICGYTRKACRSQPGPDTDEGNEIYLEWAELAVENCIRGAEEWKADLENESRSTTNSESVDSCGTSSINLLDVRCPKFGSRRPLTPYYRNNDTVSTPPGTASLHDGFQDYCPPERHQRSPSTFVPKLKPRTPRGPSVTSLVNSFNNLATTASQSGIPKPNIVEEESTASSKTEDEVTVSEEPLPTPGLSLIPGYFHKLIDNPINYIKRMFHDEEYKAPEPETKPEEQNTTNDIPEHPAVALTRLEMSYVRDNFHNYIEAEPPTREELAASLRNSIS